MEVLKSSESTHRNESGSGYSTQTGAHTFRSADGRAWMPALPCQAVLVGIYLCGLYFLLCLYIKAAPQRSPARKAQYFFRKRYNTPLTDCIIQ